ncbi:MAG TPA: hypothetical protein VIQ22_00815 [Gammaproteobacteria bacterium]
MSVIEVTKVEEANDIGPHGEKIVARFNVAFGEGVYIDCCALVRRPRHGWSIWGPSRSVQFTRRTRKEIKLAVLRAMGREIPPQME